MDYRNIIMHFFRIFPINKKKVVFSSYYGRSINDCPKNISDVLHEIAPDLEQVWVLNNNVEHPEYVECVKPGSLRSVFEFATSKIWIDNCRKPSWYDKRKGQFYFQTWHGGVCLKHVEKDASDTLTEEYINNAIRDSEMADYFISECEWRTQNFRDAFWYDGEVLRCGFNRMNINPSIDYHDKVCRKLEIPNNNKLVLYAPTFRDDGRLSCYDIDYQSLVDVLKKKFGNEYTIIIRLHPNIAQLNNKIEYSDNVINGTQYPSIEELITASDILITDYSGCMFDGFRIEKIVLIYASDIEEYVVNERGFYFDLKELPAPIAVNNAELHSIISDFDLERYHKERKDFVDKLGYYKDGNFETVAEKILEIIKK